MCNEKKIFISDLHIGDGSKSDDFNRQTDLIRLLDDHSSCKIVILGDIYELWQARLANIMWYNSEIVRRLQRDNVICVHGNHDFLPYSKIWPNHYEDDLIYAEHGHQYDVYNNTSMFNLKWPIGKYVTVVVGWLEKLWHKDADEYLLKKYGEFKYQAAKLHGAEKSTSSIQLVLDKTQKPIVVQGHTHEALLIKTIHRGRKRIIANCGSWVGGAEPTYVEVEDKTVRLRHGITYNIIKEEK
ncbi:metallophosphoesterase family protein [Candidatus Pacearchaeota archaeon]|nr:metallophosphoesterase family protein [Candidatus Pacearchaeota archaeon]